MNVFVICDAAGRTDLNERTFHDEGDWDLFVASGGRNYIEGVFIYHVARPGNFSTRSEAVKYATSSERL